MLSPFMESLNGEETVIQGESESYYPGRWKNLTKEASATMPLSSDIRMTIINILFCNNHDFWITIECYKLHEDDGPKSQFEQGWHFTFVW